MKPNKKICGAKKRNGEPCQAKSMSNGRCRLHGGLSTGPKKGSQNAKKHGIYSKFYTDEEAALVNDIEIGKVDDELKLLRIRLHRLLTYEAKNRGNRVIDFDLVTPSVDILGENGQLLTAGEITWQ